MHVLRHTYATRAIEGGIRPKTLQVILGHSNVGITMNLYVHVTEDEKLKEGWRKDRKSIKSCVVNCVVKNIEKGRNPVKSRAFRQVKIKMKLGIVIF